MHRTIVALGLTSLFTDLGAEMIFPLLPAFIVSLGGSAIFLGLIEGLAEATSSLLKLVTGGMSDRLRLRKPIVLAGYALAAVVRPLVSIAQAPWHVLTIRLTDRFGKGIRSTPRDVLIAAAAAPGEEGRAFGFHSAMDHAGAVIGPLVAAALIAWGLELRTIFLATAIPGLLSVLCVLLVRELPREPKAANDAPNNEALPKPLSRYLVALAIFSLGNSSDGLLLLRAHDLGVSAAGLPVLWSLFHVAKLTSAYLGGSWADRVRKTELITAGWAVYGLTYLGFAAAKHAWQMWILFIIYGVYYGLTEPAEKAMVKELTHESARGRAYGWYNFTLGISAVPAGLLAGWLWETFGPRTALVVGAAFAGLASYVFVSFLAPPSSKSGSAPGHA